MNYRIGLNSKCLLLLISLCLPALCVEATHESKKRVAVVGGGGAGVTASWLLDEECEVTLYEIENRLGGDAYTVDIEIDTHVYPVDAGFEFLNAQAFPHFIRLLDVLKVNRSDFQLTASFTEPSLKSFVITPISDDGIALGSILKPKNLAKLIRLKSFFDKAKKAIDINSEGDIQKEFKTIGQFLEEIDVNKNFRDDFLLPMLASGWGITSEEIMDWSMENVMRTVLSEADGIAAPKWQEIIGGTRAYILAAQSQMKNSTIRLNTEISSILYHEKLGKYEIITPHDSQWYDELIMAVPPHQIAKLLRDIYLPEIATVREAQSKVEFYESRIALHGDVSFMPKKQRHWTVVNVRSNKSGTQTGMTMYKRWNSKEDAPIFKSWLLDGDPLPQPLYSKVSFLHRKLNMNYVRAKAATQEFQGKYHLWFIGTHTLGDRHENAVISAMNVVKHIAPNAKRLKVLKGRS